MEGAASIFRRSFGLDYRSLAFYRICLGLVIVGDLADRAHDLHNHYTDDGLYPRRLSMIYWHPFWLNPYLMNGSYIYTLLLFCFHAIVGLLLSVGYKTRWMIVLAWILQASLQARNISVGHGGDIYFRCILFWSLFLPLSKVWSIDRYLKDQDGVPRKPKTKYFFGVASVAYLLQPTYLYTLAYYLKTHDWWTKDYIAAYYAVRLEYFSDGMPIGQLLLRYPFVLPFLTWASLVWEGYGCLLYYSPVFHGPCRFLGAIGMIVLHAGFSAALRLGTFCWITICAQLALLPDWFWESLVPLLRRVFPSFDRLLLHAHSLLLQCLEHLDTLRHWYHSLLSIRRLPPSPSRRSPLARYLYVIRRTLTSLFVAAMVLGVLGWNINTMYEEPPFKWTDKLYPLGERLGIDQNWGMFAPRPPEGDYWFVIECLSVSGDTFELFREGGLFTWEGSPVSFDMPVPFVRPFYNHRWSKYWETYVDSDFELVRDDLVRWICVEWNTRHEEPDWLSMFDVYVVEHGHLLNGTNQPWGSTHLYHAECFDRRDSEPTEGAEVNKNNATTIKPATLEELLRDEKGMFPSEDEEEKGRMEKVHDDDEKHRHEARQDVQLQDDGMNNNINNKKKR